MISGNGLVVVQHEEVTCVSVIWYLAYAYATHGVGGHGVGAVLYCDVVYGSELQVTAYIG